MKSKLILLLIVFTILEISCNKSKQVLIGNWSDNIHLSQKTATLKSTQDSISITTKNAGWWIDGISLDSINMDSSTLKIVQHNSSYTINDADFQINVINGKIIEIVMPNNPKSYERHLRIGLEAGDYFDGIQITQKAATE